MKYDPARRDIPGTPHAVHREGAPVLGDISSRPLVVAVGGAAGGLDAARKLFAAVPADAPVCFILLLDLDPTHDATVQDVIARATRLPVLRAEDGMRLSPGCILAPPPGACVTVVAGVVRLVAPQHGHCDGALCGVGGGGRFDCLLRSLAEHAGSRPVCVVLSGAGRDGALGAEAVHAAGGLVMVQDPREAGYAAMPEAAIAAEAGARVLPVAAMPAALEDHAGGARNLAAPARGANDGDLEGGGGAEGGAEGGDPKDGGLKDDGARDDGARDDGGDVVDDILDLARKAAAADAALQRCSATQRRIRLRMAALGIPADAPARYLVRLRADRAELVHLAGDLSDRAAGFLRDPESLARMAETALPDLIRAAGPTRRLRLWALGPGAGEEAYSLAMLAIEAVEAAGADIRVQVIASDDDDDAMAAAREGHYPDAALAGLSEARWRRFFHRDFGGWQVSATLREAVLPARHDILIDPPFAHIDLISCRRLLTRLEPEARRHVLGMFRFALRPQGLLLLGRGESPGEAEDRFALVDAEAQLWRRIGPARAEAHRAGASKRAVRTRRGALTDLARRQVLGSNVAAAVLLDRNLSCLYLLGRTERYLRLSPGLPSHGFLDMAPSALREALRRAAAACGPDAPVVRVAGGRTEDGEGFAIELRALMEDGEALLLACFVAETPPADAPDAEAPHADAPHSDASHSGAPAPPADSLAAQPRIAQFPGPIPRRATEDPSGSAADAARIHDLEGELREVRGALCDSLRETRAEQRRHQTDLAHALASAEGTRAANEALESATEELGSLNEELTAMNRQLHEMLGRNRGTTSDLRNVIACTDVAAVFLDRALNIRFFTPAAQAQFHVVAADLGRPLAHFAALTDDPGLLRDVETVLDTGETIERETPGPRGSWFVRRVRPYLDDGGGIDGAAITYTGVTELRRATGALQFARLAAERADAAKSRFLATANHDLRQPLQSLTLIHQLLARGRDDADGKRLHAMLDRTMASMTDMLDTMLDANRIESGAVTPQIDDVPLGPLLARLAEEFRVLAEERGLRLRAVPTRAVVRSDPRLLEQMLRNLLSNAVKYTPQGSILLGCRRRGDRVGIEVWDTGIGMAPKDLSAIFDPYRQAEGAQRTSAKGLGLGLSIVWRLGELLDHPVSVRSTQGRGSGFALNVQVSGQAADPAPPPLAERERRFGVILLVEDEPDLCELLTAMLTAEGHRVLVAHGIDEALAHLADATVTPDLLLSDFDLRDTVDGIGLAVIVAERLGRPLPTLILTGDMSTLRLREIARAGHERVAKPAQPAQIAARVAAMLHGPRAAAASTEPVAATPREDVGGGAEGAPVLHVVDDDAGVRAATRRLFEANGWRVVDHASAEAFLASPRPTGDACLLVDARLPGIDGVALIDLLRREGNATPSVMLTGHGDAPTAAAAVKAGASDYVEKPASSTDLLHFARRALERSRDARAAAEARLMAAARFRGLTPRERQIMALVLEGAPNKIIAADLGISQRTVENHRAAVMRKTGAESLPALVRLAIVAGHEATDAVPSAPSSS